MNQGLGTGKPARVKRNFRVIGSRVIRSKFGYFMKEKIRDRQKNSSYPGIRVKRVRVNGFQLYLNLFIYRIFKDALAIFMTTILSI